jgi:FkbM family methyltransferase
MGTTIYRAKRALRLPLVWYQRGKHADLPPKVKAKAEQFGYSRAVFKAMARVAVDPHYFYRAQLDPSSVVIDVGAYDGLVADQLFGLYDCQIYAFEPNPELYPELENRFVDNPKVMTLPYGLGAADVTLSLQLRGLGSTVYGRPDPTVKTADVEIRDVVDVLRKLGHPRIDFMKINIEGAEYDLLDRLLATEWKHHVRYFLIQFHELYDDANVRRWRIRRRLRETHSQVWNLPWIYELWCAKDRPHPEAPKFKFSRGEKAQIRRELNAQRDERLSRA